MFRKLEDAMGKLLTLSVVIAGMVVCASGQSSQEPSQGAVPAMQGPGLSGQSNDAYATDCLLPKEAGGRMATPGAVSIEGYSMDFTSEQERAKYLRAGLRCGSSYCSN